MSSAGALGPEANDDYAVGMICRVATFDKKPDISDEKLDAFRSWMKTQPGLKAHYHVYDPETGKGMSIAFWESMEHLMALKHRAPPGGPLNLKPNTVETFSDVVASYPDPVLPNQ